MIRRALGAVLLLTAAAGASAQEPAPPPDAARRDWSDWRPQFPAATEFVAAIAIEEQAARIIDSFWRPATAALVAANPGKAEAARGFAAGERARELAIYPPMVAMMVDREAVELLNPELEPQLKALLERRSADYSRTRDISEASRLAYAEEHRRITSAAAARANGDLLDLARLARTPDGLAMRELQRQGFYECEFWKPRGRLLPEDEARCAKLATPAVARLRASPLGARLIRLGTFAHAHLMAMVAMGHAAGLSLRGLLPPDKVRAAGLAVPPDQAIEMLPPDEPAKP